MTSVKPGSRPGVTIHRCDLAHPDAQTLINELNADLKADYPRPGETHFGLSDVDVSPGVGAFLVARLDGVAVSCGAVRSIAPGFGELKRMFTRPEFRGMRYAEIMIEALENEARSLGLTDLCLETGQRSPSAIRLYQRCGFAECDRWGDYVLSPNTSFCMRKKIA